MYHRLSVTPCVYAAPLNSRSLCAVEASKEAHRYVLGTCDVGGSNQVQCLEFSEEKNKIDVVASFSLSSQVNKIESSIDDEAILLASCTSTQGSHSLNVLRIPENNLVHSSDVLGMSLDLQEFESNTSAQSSSLISALKQNRKKPSTVLTIDATHASLWSMGDGQLQNCSQLKLPDKSKVLPWSTSGVSWNPHSANSAAIVSGSDLLLLDSQSMTITSSKTNAHKFGVRGVDYNPNRPMMLLTCGNDRLTKLWDLRNLSTPVKVLAGHTHWVTSALYNPNHDQLILTGGSDAAVNLWRIASCSSSPWVTTADCDESEDPADVKVKCIDQHEDSVYALAWSAVDAWSFCSLSYDGRVAVNLVPTTEKYKILL